MIGVKLVGDWKLAQRVLSTAPAAFDRALKKAIGEEAERIAGGIRKKIASNVPPPNAQSTVLLKHSSKTLIASGEMQKTVQVIWKGKYQAFVGIPASARKGLARLADLHENGRVIIQQMSDKQRKFLHALFKGIGAGTGGSGIIVIHIPPRPFIKPVFDDYASGADKKFLKAVGEELGPWSKGS